MYFKLILDWDQPVKVNVVNDAVNGINGYSQSKVSSPWLSETRRRQRHLLIFTVTKYNSRFLPAARHFSFYLTIKIFTRIIAFPLPVNCIYITWFSSSKFCFYVRTTTKSKNVRQHSILVFCRVLIILRQKCCNSTRYSNGF